MANARFSNAEVKAGVFLTFCIGLFIAMLFVYGKVNRSWRGQSSLHVVFTQVANVRQDSRVHYNGLEVGRIKSERITQINEEMLANFPKLAERDLEKLPLTDQEREDLRGVSTERLDEEIRKRILGRTVVALELEVLYEGDAKRYRDDDYIRISTSLMGEAVVEILSGSGESIPPDSPRILIGASGDMYSDLAKSLSQVKDIVGSMSEMVGGGDVPMAQKLGNFDTFTSRVDLLAMNLEKNLPSMWDSLDKRLGDGGERVHAMEKAISGMKPDLIKALEGAEKSLHDMRAQVKTMSEEASGQIKTVRKRTGDELGMMAPIVKAYKDKLPLAIRDAREWTESIYGRVVMIESWMTESDRYMKEGVQSVRNTLQGMRGTADNLEEKTWYLANYPWSVTATIDPQEGMSLDAQWRKALLSRHYKAVREGLERVRSSVHSNDPSDQARLARVAQIVQEMDLFLGIGGAVPPSVTPKK